MDGWIFIVVSVLFVCLEFLFPLDIFHSNGDVIIAGEGLQTALHSWPLSNEGSLACHTHYGERHPFTMVIYENT